MGVGDSGCLAGARVRFSTRLGGLALASEQVAKNGWHSVRVGWGGGGSTAMRTNDGMRGETDMSGIGVLY